jgi:ADP-ribose pyrophosphatase YjhB (NUDIX family)
MGVTLDVGLAVDVVVLAGRGAGMRVLLVRSDDEPYPGMWALPGADPVEREPFALAARRGLLAATGIRVAQMPQPFGCYDEPDRFRPSWAVAVVFLLRLAEPVRLRPVAREAGWHPALAACRAPVGVVREQQRMIGDAVALLGRR